MNQITSCCLLLVALALWGAGPSGRAATPAKPAPVLPNLLRNNPGLEAAAVPGHGHGGFALPGWDAEQFDFGWTSVGVAEDDAPEGKRRLYINGGGRVTTATADRAPVQPGRLYRMRFQAKTAKDDSPGDFTGLIASLLFYDKDGHLLKDAKRLDVENGGPYPWQVFTLDAVAPSGAIQAGVQIVEPGGKWPHPGSRSSSVDDFGLFLVPETQDSLVVRRAPCLLQPGQTDDLNVKFTALGARDIVVQLMSGTKIVSGARASVAAGRGLTELRVPVPKNAPPGGAYRWILKMVPAGGSAAGHPFAVAVVSGAFVDEKMSGVGTALADNPDILYAGRWDRTDPKNPICYWGGSQILTRFRGTSLKAKMASADTNEFLAVLDGNVDHMTKIHPQGGQMVVATGLPDTDHTLLLMKNTESGNNATFQGFTLDPGRGLLRPEPLPARRIEFYGDSITSGGAPDPKKPNPDPNSDGDYDGNFDRTYAAYTARELGADWHPISKGGTGVAGSWVFSYNMLDYWDKLNFDGFDPQKARVADFAAWQPQAVVITVGHNDRFRAPSREAWAKNYASLIQNLHRVYPNAQIFCSNTAMSSDWSWWAAALLPLLAHDPKLHFQLFDPAQNHGGHPRLEDHKNMAQGTPEWNGMADWIGDTLGW